MSQGAVRTVLAAVLAGCFSSAKYDQAHEQRVVEINDRYDSMEDKTIEGVQQLRSQIDEFRKFLIEVKPGSNYAPVDRVDGRKELAKIAAACGDPQLTREQRNECMVNVYVPVYLPALQSRYFRADFDWAIAQWTASNGASDLEALLTYSHNTALLDYIHEQSAQIDMLVAEQRERIAAMREREIEASAEQREHDVAEAHARYREKLAVIGAALQGAGQALSQRSATSTLPPTQAAAGGCSSDYECGFGHQCVKPNFSGNGTCVESVNAFGTPTYRAPDPNSVMVKMPVSTDCKFSTDCPISFRCDTSSGACVK